MGVPHFRGGLLIGKDREGRTSRCFSGAMEERKKKAIGNGGSYRDTRRYCRPVGLVRTFVFNR